MQPGESLEDNAMKELLVIRHGKSSWDDPDLDDHERPLAKRGRKAAPTMGTRLRGRDAVPQRMVTSDALRACETATAVAEAAGVGADAIDREPRLYTADAATVLAVVRDLDDRLECAAIVGHNPALHDFVHRICDLRIDKLPTAAVAHLRFVVSCWSEVEWGSAEVVDYDYPKSGRH